VSNSLISTNFQAGGDNDRDWLDFKGVYKARYASEPDRIAALGYDATMLALQAIKDKEEIMPGRRKSPKRSRRLKITRELRVLFPLTPLHG